MVFLQYLKLYLTFLYENHINNNTKKKTKGNQSWKSNSNYNMETLISL